MLDAPVRSLRVANALTERVAVLATTSTLHPTPLDLRIGEAQSLYPEIWRHLDDARDVLHANGRDVSRYAALGAAHVDIKTAKYNVDGLRAAADARRALEAALPEVDWAALAMREANVVSDAGSLHSPKPALRWLAIAAGILAAMIALWFLVL